MCVFVVMPKVPTNLHASLYAALLSEGRGRFAEAFRKLARALRDETYKNHCKKPGADLYPLPKPCLLKKTTPRVHVCPGGYYIKNTTVIEYTLKSLPTIIITRTIVNIKHQWASPVS